MTIAIYGLGLMGASLALALKQNGTTVTGYARRQTTCDDALAANIVDHATTDPAQAAKNADLLIYCTPIRTIPDLVRASLPGIKPGALLTDVGSTKQVLADEIPPLLPETVTFIGSHPMCGSEQTGLTAARPDLYHNATVIITEDNPTLQTLWTNVGATPLTLSAQDHDQLVARTSHLPHLLAVLLVQTALRDPQPDHLQNLIGTGFLDTSRVASGSPAVWTDIIATNRDAILAECRATRDQLDQLIHALATDETARATLAQARDKRDAIK